MQMNTIPCCGLVFVLLVGAATAHGQSDPVATDESAVSIAYDFEEATLDEQAQSWTIPATTNDAWSVTGDAEQLEMVDFDGGRAMRPRRYRGLSVTGEALNQSYADGLEIETRFQLETLPEGKNVVLAAKWLGRGNERTFMLFYRKPHVRLSISPDGTSENGETVRSFKIEPGTTYHILAWFNPSRGELGLEHVGDAYAGKRRVKQTDIKGLHASEEPVAIGSGSFDGYLDMIRITTPAEHQPEKGQ